MTDKQELVLRESDLKPKTPVVPSETIEPIDVDIVKAFRTASIGLIGDKMSDESQMLILNVLEKGISLDMAARYAMVSPAALKKYIDAGMDEASNYTEEMYDKGIELSKQAKFAVECMHRMAKATVEMGAEFYDKCFETGNTHLMMWWLERLDKDSYHLKKKVESQNTTNINANTTVEFKFTAPETVRPIEDNELYAERLEKLNDKYGSN